MTFSNTIVAAKAIMKIIEEHDYAAGLHELANNMRTYHANPSDEAGNIAMGNLWNNTIQLYKAQEQYLRKIPHFDSVIRELGMRDVLGNTVAEKIQTIMRTEAYDTPRQIETLANGIQNSIGHVRQMLEAIDHLKVEFPVSDSGFLSIEYTNESAVKDIEQLAEQLANIKTIMHGYARLAPELEDSAPPKIISISKSSPLGIDLAASLVVLRFVGKGIKWAMDRYSQLLAIRLQAEELKEKQMLNEKVKTGLKDQEEALFSKKEVKALVAQLVKDASIKTSSKGAKSEIEVSLVQSTETLAQIIQDGALIKIHPPKKSQKTDKEQIADVEKINANIKYSEVHKLTFKIGQLEHKKATKRPKAKDAGVEKGDKADSGSNKA